MSKLEETATCDKSVAIDLECKVAKGQREVASLLENLDACKLKEAASEETIKLLQSQIEHLKEQVKNSKKDNFKFAPLSSSDFVSDTGDSQMTELKVKLSRSHSHSKRLELQLTDKEAQVAALVRENKDMRANLENSKQQAVNELLSVSEEESGLRSELSALVQKHNSLQSQYKSQSRLLLEKQKDMIQLEEKLQNSTDVNNRKRQQIVDQYAKQIAELERMNEALKLSLATETQAGVKLREKLDVVREEALDKQLDDEKQLSDLHEQLSSLRSEIWQLERSKKLDTDRFNNELAARENWCSKLEELMATTQAESEAARASLTLQLT
ncbi:testis-specific gene 10 protein-like [Watersipora subatra]|uniref:testis-specific gene 10 protein-like n=1 Tax=Watersipora subatra TaxID=2589382 RepID=UPI00355BE951